MSILSFIIPIPFWILLTLILLIIFTVFVWIYRELLIKRFAPEAKVFATARKKQLPVIEMTDSSGSVRYFLGKKKDDGDPQFEETTFGLKLDPMFTAHAPRNILKGGVHLYHFHVKFPFAIGDNNARAIEKAISIARSKQYQNALGFLSDLEILDLLGYEAGMLEDYVRTRVLLHKKENKRGLKKSIEEAVKDVVQAVNELRERLRVTPAESGVYSYQHAFELIPSAVLSTELQRLLGIFEEMWAMEHKKDVIKWIAIGFAGMMILVGAGIAIQIIKSA